MDERSHNISHAEDTSSELVSNGASACKRLLDAVAKVQQLWVFCNLYKSLNKPQTSDQTLRCRSGPQYSSKSKTALASVLLEKRNTLAALHEHAFLQRAPCSPFLTVYPQDREKVQARSTTNLIQSPEPSEPKETLSGSGGEQELQAPTGHRRANCSKHCCVVQRWHC